ARRGVERVLRLQARALGPRLLGPAVLRIASLHVLPDLGPRAAPAPGQVARRLDRASGGAGQLEQQRRAADHRGAFEPERRLDADLDARGVVPRIVDRVMRAGGGDALAR